MKVPCPKCAALSARPPSDGKHKCLNCGASWTVETQGLPLLSPTSTVADLVAALRARDASLSIEPGPAGAGAMVTISGRGVTLAVPVIEDMAAGSAPIAALDLVILAIGKVS